MKRDFSLIKPNLINQVQNLFQLQNLPYIIIKLRIKNMKKEKCNPCIRRLCYFINILSLTDNVIPIVMQIGLIYKNLIWFDLLNLGKLFMYANVLTVSCVQVLVKSKVSIIKLCRVFKI